MVLLTEDGAIDFSIPLGAAPDDEAVDDASLARLTGFCETDRVPVRAFAEADEAGRLFAKNKDGAAECAGATRGLLDVDVDTSRRGCRGSRGPVGAIVSGMILSQGGCLCFVGVARRYLYGDKKRVMGKL